MEQTPITIGDETAHAQDPSPSPRRWALIGGGVVAGLVLGTLFGASPSDPEPAPEQEPAAGSEVAAPFSPTTTTTQVAGPERLAIRIPGLIDDLVVQAADTTGTRGVWLWRARDRNPTPRTLPLGEIHADPSHTWISTVTFSRYTAAGSLWVGNDAYMEPVASGVSRAVWRQDVDASMTWAEDGLDGVNRLVRASFSPGTRVQPTTVRVLEASEAPVWWTTEGIVLHDVTGGGLRLVHEDGAVLADLDGIDKFVAGGAELAAVIRRGEPQLIDPTLAIAGNAPWPDTCGTASFRPPGNAVHMIVLGCEPDARGVNTTLQIWSVDPTEEPVLRYEASGTGLAPPAWTPDGRFAVAAWVDLPRPRTTLEFIDPRIGEPQSVGFPGTVFSVETIRAR